MKDKDSEIQRLKHELNKLKNKPPEKVYIKEYIEKEAIATIPQQINNNENASNNVVSDIHEEKQNSAKQEIVNDQEKIDEIAESVKNEEKIDNELIEEAKEEDIKSLNKSQHEVSFHKVESPKAISEKHSSENDPQEINEIIEEINEEIPKVEEIPKTDVVEDVVKIKTKEDLLHPIYQLKMKLNERNIDLQYFVDEYAFLLYEEDLELQTISDRLKEFMEYSHSEEIDDLALLLTQGENFINKDQYLKALSKEVNFIRLNQEDGK